MSENWTQPICASCYSERNPGREPSRVKAATEEQCCICGQMTLEGIYFRVDPATVKFAKPTPTGPKYENSTVELPEHVRRILENANEHIRQGSNLHFKWTCLKCGARQTFEDKNAFFLEGQCEECEHISDLCNPAVNLNYLLIHADPTAKDFRRILRGKLD